MPSALPPIAVTMGEPAGVGPELIAALWNERRRLQLPAFFAISTSEALKAHMPGLPLMPLHDIADTARYFGSHLPVWLLENKAPVRPGLVDPRQAKTVVEAINLGADFCLNKQARALVTAPIHKSQLNAAGIKASGHTDYLAMRAGLDADQSVMMLEVEGLRVIPVTIHIPLKEVASRLTSDAIIHAGLEATKALKSYYGIQNPRIAIAALNPHAGEGGMMGIEEATHIWPAIWQLRDRGIRISDPLPSDSLFHADARKNYDLVLCMYHDQALIPLKTIDFWGGVNITLGLPFIRTSPDHGTALDIAGRNLARKESFTAAIKLADRLSRHMLEADHAS